MNWTEADLAAFQARQNAIPQRTRLPDAAGKTPGAVTPVAPAGERPAPKRSKYGNVLTVGPAPFGGSMRYLSKREATEARRLRDDLSAGTIAGWATQVSVPVASLDGKLIRHLVDFLVLHLDGRIELREVKGRNASGGREPPAGRMKRAALEAMLGPVTVVS